MKKIIISLILVLFISIPSAFAWDCYNELGVKVITPTLHHVFVDVSCDMRPDIVVEYAWNGFRWIPTGNWWRL